MGKSKHIKDNQMILFFFNDFGFSETDGERKGERLAARREGRRKKQHVERFYLN